MFARRRWKCSKEGCPRSARGRRRPTRSVSWLRPLSLTMIPLSLLLAANPRNFESFEAFSVFLGILQVLAIWLVSPCARPYMGATLNGENFAFLEFSCKNTLAYGWVSDFMKIWAPKSSKYMQILTFCPFFELQKAVLGEMTFEGPNQLQIQKFQWGWKVDSETFPMSYLAPDLDTGKALKQSFQCARPVKVRGATTQGNLPVLTSSASKTLFSPWLTFEACKWWIFV